MASVYVTLRKRKNRDGSRPLILNITKNRKTSTIHLGYSLDEKYWDKDDRRVKKSHPNSKRLNNLIETKIAEASDTSLEVEKHKKDASAKTIRHKVKPHTGTTFMPQAELYLKNLKKAGNYNVYTADKPRIKHFHEFLNDGDIAFVEITEGLIERFKLYLKDYHLIPPKPDTKPTKRTKKPMSERTILNHLVAIRSVFSHAKKEGIIEKHQTPFGEGKISIKFPETTKVGLSKEDVEKLEKVKLDHAGYDHARNLWLISYYFAGMRISDVLRLRWSDFQDMRLHYKMGKNQKAGSLKTPEKALLIIDKYESARKKDNDLIFPDLKKLRNLDDAFIVKRTIAFATSRYDKFLRLYVAPAAKIKGRLTMHISRHTFATLASDKIPIQMLQKLYRHADVKTTLAYQANFIHKDADAALDAVLGK